MGDNWSVAWRILDAQYWGVPQRRRRIALIADFGGNAAPEILFEREGVCRDFAPGGETGQGTAADSVQYTDGADCERNLTVFESHGQAVCLPINTQIATRHKALGERTGLGIGNDGDPAFTLQASHEHGVMCMAHGQANAEILTDKSPTLTCNHEQPIAFESVVRRLTPLECERLQGYPNGWTDIEWLPPHRKTPERAKDSPRYKAIGNSIALPQWKWVLKRIAAQYERDATLGSLFDGIGGFPLLWEQLNGKGSCRWVSEIEPFCVAVTKHHFIRGTHDTTTN